MTIDIDAVIANANIIADIVGHPSTAPTLEELDYMNPSLRADEIRRQLADLEDEGIVTTLNVDPEDRRDNSPYKFFSITAEAREIFDQHGIFPEGAWKRGYQAVEKPDRIQAIEEMDRPHP